MDSDPYGLAPDVPGAKLDQGKQIAGELILGFPHALTEVIKVASFGAAKYSRHGFLSVPGASVRYLDAAMRHLLAYGKGETHDPESGCLHLAQAAWNLLAILETDQRAAVGLFRPADASPQHEAGGNPVAGKPAAQPSDCHFCLGCPTCEGVQLVPARPETPPGMTTCSFCGYDYPVKLGFFGCPNCEGALRP